MLDRVELRVGVSTLTIPLEEAEKGILDNYLEMSREDTYLNLTQGTAKVERTKGIVQRLSLTCKTVWSSSVALVEAVLALGLLFRKQARGNER